MLRLKHPSFTACTEPELKLSTLKTLHCTQRTGEIVMKDVNDKSKVCVEPLSTRGDSIQPGSVNQPSWTSVRNFNYKIIY